jgi:calcineurin-like phosphoesterase family protein
MGQEEYRRSNGLELTRVQHNPEKSVFVISDLHLKHKNIIRYCKRPFDSVREMNRVLIKNWNCVVKPDDIVFFVGDMALGVSDNYIPKLNGNIYFIWGNHDKTTDPDSMHESLYCSYKGVEFLFIHDPKFKPPEFSGWVIHGHHHNNHPDSFPFLNPEKKQINVSVELVKYQPISLDYIHSLIMKRHEKIASL